MWPFDRKERLRREQVQRQLDRVHAEAHFAERVAKSCQTPEQVAVAEAIMQRLYWSHSNLRSFGTHHLDFANNDLVKRGLPKMHVPLYEFHFCNRNLYQPTKVLKEFPVERPSRY